MAGRSSKAPSRVSLCWWLHSTSRMVWNTATTPRRTVSRLLPQTVQIVQNGLMNCSRGRILFVVTITEKRKRARKVARGGRAQGAAINQQIRTRLSIWFRLTIYKSIAGAPYGVPQGSMRRKQRPSAMYLCAPSNLVDRVCGLKHDQTYWTTW